MRGRYPLLTHIFTLYFKLCFIPLDAGDSYARSCVYNIFVEFFFFWHYTITCLISLKSVQFL